MAAASWYSICDIAVNVVCHDPDAALRVHQLLCRHSIATPESATPPVTLAFDFDSRDTDAAHSLARSGSLCFESRAGAASLLSPNRLYYQVVLPAVTEILRSLGAVRFHCAAVLCSGGRVVVVSGPAGAGKSTLALSWLAAGGQVLSDDVLFIRPRGDGLLCDGLRRPFHLAPDVVARHSSLPNITAAKPYSKTRPKLAYDVWEWAPVWHQGFVTPLVTACLSEVAGNELSDITVLPTPSVVHELNASCRVAADDPTCESPLAISDLEGLFGKHVLRAKWGRDVLAEPASYQRLLHQALEAC